MIITQGSQNIHWQELISLAKAVEEKEEQSKCFGYCALYFFKCFFVVQNITVQCHVVQYILVMQCLIVVYHAKPRLHR